MSDGIGISSRCWYIHHRGAFSVARLDKQGNSRALTREASDRTGSTFFCISISCSFLSAAVVAKWHNTYVYGKRIERL